MLLPYPGHTVGDVGAHSPARRPGLLREEPQFRRLFVSRAISFTGDGAARIALVLLAASTGPGAVGLVLLVDTAPRLLGPLAGAVADRVDQRRLLAGCEVGQAVIYAGIAATTPPVPALLPLVAGAALLATLFGPADKSSVPRLVPADRLTRANALLGTAFNLQIVAGPAIGGALAGFAGPAAAFALNAASFLASAALLLGLPPLPPVAARTAAGLLVEMRIGLAYAIRTPVVRALVAGVLLLVSFAAIENVALVFLVEDSLNGSPTAYGAIVAADGAGMLAASLVLARIAERRRAQQWLAVGVVCSAAGIAGTGVAPAIGLAALAQFVAGTGNAIELVANDTIVQQQVPRHLLGRVFGAVSTAAQAGSAAAYVVAGPLVAWTGPRVTFAVAGTGVLLCLVVLRPALSRGS